MSPFELGMVQAYGFHAVMSRKVAQTQTRQVQGRSYPFFYNPMWGLQGDSTQGPPASFYYSASGKPTAYFWHMFDQVLIRPSLLTYFDDCGNTNPQILVSDGVNSLLTEKGYPNKEQISDHLPLLFRLNLNL